MKVYQNQHADFPKLLLTEDSFKKRPGTRLYNFKTWISQKRKKHLNGNRKHFSSFQKYSLSDLKNKKQQYVGHNLQIIFHVNPLQSGDEKEFTNQLGLSLS